MSALPGFGSAVTALIGSAFVLEVNSAWRRRFLLINFITWWISLLLSNAIHSTRNLHISSPYQNDSNTPWIVVWNTIVFITVRRPGERSCNLDKSCISSTFQPDDEPGPGQYGPWSAIGQQHLSQHASPPTAKVFGRNRKSCDQMWISKHHLGELLGRDTPGAGTYDFSTQTFGKRNSMKFGGARRRTEFGQPSVSPGPAYDTRGSIARTACRSGSALRKANRYALDNVERAMRAHNVCPGE